MQLCLLTKQVEWDLFISRRHVQQKRPSRQREPLKIGSEPRSDNPGIPHGQWNLQSKEVDGRMPSAKTKFDLCWRQCSPSKWHSRMKNPRALRDNQGDAYTCIKMVAGSGNNPSLAICHANGKPSLQLNATLVAH